MQKQAYESHACKILVNGTFFFTIVNGYFEHTFFTLAGVGGEAGYLIKMVPFKHLFHLQRYQATCITYYFKLKEILF